MYTYPAGVVPPTDRGEAARALPVFLGMLSLTAAPACRILSEKDLNHQR